VEEGLAVGERQDGAVGGHAGEVAGVGDGVAQAEQALVAGRARRVVPAGRHDGCTRAQDEEEETHHGRRHGCLLTFLNLQAACKQRGNRYSGRFGRPSIGQQMHAFTGELSSVACVEVHI
jgi:hypothetical protein